MSQLSAVSYSEVLTLPPRRVLARSIRLAKIPMVAHMPDPMSTMDAPVRTGGRPPPSPVTLISPAKACISGS